MSFFKKMLASVGIGSATVDTELDSIRVVAGDWISGTVHIQGGQVEQQIEAIFLSLKCYYARALNDQGITHTAVIAKYKVADGFHLQAGHRETLPFRYRLPENMPITLRDSPVWIETGLDIDNGADSSDKDLLEVLPSPEMRTVLDAMDRLGFGLRKITNSYAPSLGRGLPFVQEFEYDPSPSFRRTLDELEAVFFPRNGNLEVMLQVDRRARGFSGRLAEALNLDEIYVRIYFTREELRSGPDHIAAMLEEVIAGHP